MPALNLARSRKHDAIMRAALDEFFDRGFAAASIEAIAQRAGVSKVTIYTHFGDKQTLLAAAIQTECDRMQREIIDESEAGDAPAVRLARFGRVMLTMLAHPRVRRFAAIIEAEKAADAELRSTFMAAGPDRMRGLLADMLSEIAAEGDHHFPEPQYAATIFAGMARSFVDFRAPDDDAEMASEIATHCNEVAYRFLRAYRIR